MARNKKPVIDQAVLKQLPLDSAQRRGVAEALAAGDNAELAASLGDAGHALERLQALNAQFAALRKSTKMVLTVDKLPAYAVLGTQQMMVSE